MPRDVDRTPVHGVILVEGAAEQVLVSAFAAALGIFLTGLGVAVRPVAESDFATEVELLQHDGAWTPHGLLMARDGQTRQRLIGLFRTLEADDGYDRLDTEALIALGQPLGYVVAAHALELELFRGGLGPAIRRILEAELPLDAAQRADLEAWVHDPDMLQDERLATLASRVGRERFALALAPHVGDATCPDAVREVLQHIRDALA